ncbi:MAG: helix-turn-helix domain-containing protein [Actinobacteria bacterium]|nr:helix-turn-helix domain-containing protein [Actinomycetota bacterium]
MPRTPAWLTEDEVVERLGLSLAEVYEEITARRLPAQRSDRSYLVRRSDVETFLVKRSVSSA